MTKAEEAFNCLLAAEKAEKDARIYKEHCKVQLEEAIREEQKHGMVCEICQNNGYMHVYDPISKSAYVNGLCCRCPRGCPLKELYNDKSV